MRRIALFALLQLVFLSACGGSGNDLNDSGSGSSQTIASPAANVVSMSVDAGPPGTSGSFNIPFVRVTVCAPGSATNCQTFDHIQVDTGS
ncbi:MAG: DUF3443 family protein, partial [Steroidobacteraceae bacterium]